MLGSEWRSIYSKTSANPLSRMKASVTWGPTWVSEQNPRTKTMRTPLPPFLPRREYPLHSSCGLAPEQNQLPPVRKQPCQFTTEFPEPHKNFRPLYSAGLLEAQQRRVLILDKINDVAIHYWQGKEFQWGIFTSSNKLWIIYPNYTSETREPAFFEFRLSPSFLSSFCLTFPLPSLFLSLSLTHAFLPKSRVEIKTGI